MSFKSGVNNVTPEVHNDGDIIRCGVLKKMKTGKKKWFVLRGETPEMLARLEYHDTYKKFKSGLPPKRFIPLKTCFNINRRCDTKHKHVIALYTKDDCFCVVLESEDDLNSWLKDLLTLQHGEEIPEGQTPRPKFEYVWQVHLCNRGLGAGIVGTYRLCLTDKTLTLVRLDDGDYSIELPLASVRSCGWLQNFFFLDMGRSSQLGAGGLWFEAYDGNIANNIHTTVMHRFNICQAQLAAKDDMKPETRIRSSSATETSKPKTKRYIFSAASKTHIFPQGLRERCDSMPSRSRTTSEGSHPVPMWGRPYLVPHRPHVHDLSHSPPTGSPISPPSDSAGSSYSLPDENDCASEQEGQRMCSIPLTPEEAIAEEDCPDSPERCDSDSNYVPMSQQQISDYQEMSPRGIYNAPSNSASMSSVTSGTPSTDLKFSDYPLDKVISYFSSENEDARPARSFSVGSKPPGILIKHADLAGTPENSRESSRENSRVRAFSVGAKSKKIYNRVLPPHHPQPGIKSSSAPLLSNSRAHSSHGSIGPMDDLMELDFSSRSRTYTYSSGYADMRPSCNHRNITCVNNNNKTPSGYVEMKPGVDPIIKTSTNEVSPYVDMTQGQRNSSYVDMSAGSANSAYVDMSGSSPLRNSLSSPQEDYNIVDINRQYNRNASNNGRTTDYVDMAQKRNRTNSASSFTRPATSPGYQWPSDYMDMSGNSRKSDRFSINSQVSPSPQVQSVSPKNTDYMPLGFNHQNSRIPEVSAQTPEGYVEMTPGQNKHQRQSSLDSANITGNEEYLNMSGVTKKTDRPLSKKEKTRSQPITILTTSNNQATKNSSPISITTFFGRKSSTGTPPRMHLPLSSWTTSPYSSLPRQKSRKNSSSKDSSSSSVTTPSSSSTIFPMSLNSPSSPPSKTGTPTRLKIPTAILNAVYKPSKSKDVQTNDEGYTLMDFESTNKNNSTVQNNSDYVNYCPSTTTSKGPVKPVPKSYDDYAIMKPGTIETSKSMTLPLIKTSGSTSSLVSHLSNVDLSEPQTMFRPIKEKEDRLGGRSPKLDDRTSVDMMEEEKSDSINMEVEESPYETLRAGDFVPLATKVSRPSSPNSDKIKNSSPRPCSLGDTTSRSPPVCSDGKQQISRPGSTSSVYSCSSSSTVVGNSRPESVNSDRVVQLHYASLDLATAEDNSSPKLVKGSSSEANLMQCEPTFVYAEIDFIKSEGLNNNSTNNSGSMSSNTKVN